MKFVDLASGTHYACSGSRIGLVEQIGPKINNKKTEVITVIRAKG